MQYKFKMKPFAHQIEALKRSVDKENYAYFMEMGTGKSKVLIDNMSMLYDKGRIDGVLIIAPKGVYRNWLSEELPLHLPDHIEKTIVLWKAAISKTQQRRLNTLFETNEDLHILLMNVESLSTKKGVDFATRFLISHKTLLAIDESTTIKNPKAKRTRNILELSKDAKYRRILTGSPVTKSPLDLFTQCYFLDPFLLGFFSFYAYRNRYAHMRRVVISGREINLVASYQRLDELEQKIKPFSYRILKEDCLDLPPKVWTKRFITLTSEQKKVYEQMRTTALAQLDGNLMTTVTVLTQLMRLHQITCGHMKTDEDEIIDLKNNRLDELMSILDEVTGKAIIWANYQHDILKIENAIKKRFADESKDIMVTYYGLTPPDERHKNIKKFQENKETRFLVGNPQTGGYGITLTAANTVIYYSNSYDLEKRLQSEDRAHRIGQKHKVNYIDIVAEDTVDEKIVQSLRNKINIASQIMGEELRSWI